MTSITQTVPNYTSGISQQPDQFKNPGQVNDAVNVIPDVTKGLVKRPGSSFIKTLTSNANDTYFHYYRDSVEQYIGQIKRDGTNSTPTVKLWCLKDIPVLSKSAGDEMTVNAMSSEITDYLKHSNVDELQFTTINDITYINNTTKTVEMSTSTAADRLNHNCAYIELKQTANARQYAFNLFTNNNANTEIKTVTRLKHKDLYPDHQVILWNGTDFDNTNLTTAGKLTLPEINNWQVPCHSRHGSVANDNDACGINEATCIDVGTKIFTSEDTNVVVYDSSNNVVTNRKNLVWRFTVKGSSNLRSNAGSEPQAIDYTCRYEYDIDLLHGGEGWVKGDYIKFRMPSISPQPQDGPGGGGERIFQVIYYIEVEDISSAMIKADLLPARPVPTAFDQDTAVNAQTILGQMQEEVQRISTSGDTYYQSSADKQVTSTIVGNGLYLTRPGTNDDNKFNIETPHTELMNVFSKEINDVSKLPTQCVDGYIVKVLNSDIKDDDYYLKFKGDNGNHGPGSWIECAEPKLEDEYKKSTMPLQLVRNANGTFTIQQVDYIKRDVGDESTNPKASFVDNTINKVLFWRNRVAFLSGANVILSKPGDDNIVTPDFWAKTALTLSPEDVIDLTASSTYPSNLKDGIETPSGLLLFSENQQFLMTAEAEILSAETAKIDPIASYNYNTKVSPFSLGTTTGFLDNAGKKTRMFEMVNVQRSREPTILEQSVVVPELLPKNIDLLTSSTENNTVFVAVSGTNTIYGYRYFNSGEKRIQSAWFKWKLKKNIDYMALIDDVLYTFGEGNYLLAFDLKESDTTGNIDTVVDANNPIEIDHPIHLDNMQELAASVFTYSNTTNKTTFTLPTGYWADDSVAVIDDTPNDGTTNTFGRYAIATVSGSTGTLTGDWATGNHALYVGYNFDMEVTFPKIYVRRKEVVDLTSSLIVHRIKIGLGDSGVYETTIKRDGKDDYTELIESSYQDLYQSNTSPWLTERTHTLPTYERNTNLTFTLKSTHPSPATVYSMSWEGDYTNRYYKRV